MANNVGNPFFVIQAGGGTGGGGAGAPTFTINETAQHSDTLVLNPTLNETEQHSETLVLNPTLNDTEDRLDAFLLPTMSFTSNETEQHSEFAVFGPITLTAPARSGTPDADEWGDAWTDNTVGQTGVNHGNVSPLAMAVGIAGVGVNLAWVEVNLTRFKQLTPIGGAHTFTCVATNGSALLASTITLKGGISAISGGSARGFTESTITQANQPATPSSFTATANLAAGATNATLTFTLTDFAINTILGSWATLQLSSSAGTVATPDTVVSREGAAGNRMTLTFTGQV